MTECKDCGNVLVSSCPECSPVGAFVQALQDLVDDSYSLIEQPSWIRPATGLGVYRCHQCEATKGQKIHGHAPDCAVGKAEKLLGERC